MKIIIAPSKTQNIKNLEKSNTLVFNDEKTINLFKDLKKESKESLGKLMKIKNKLLDNTYETYQNFQEDNLRVKAIDLYTGVVFKEINTEKYNKEQTNYLNKHLVILSAMYGVVRPNDYLWPYRLDMNMKLKNINLYDYWKNSVKDYFKEAKVIINLSSNEFSKMVSYYQDKMITIHFKEEDLKGKLRTVSYNAKKARGQIAHQLIINEISSTEKIKKLTILDYKYNEELSTNNNWVFIKSN